MRILHVLSQTELTGAEVYAVTLAASQQQQGDQPLIVTDKLHVPTTSEVLLRPISKRRWPQRLRNIREFKRIIRERKIDVVHAHSRASSWVCYWATRGTSTALVSTVHGRQHLHLSVKLYSIYGDRVIAVCENLRAHLRDEVGIDSARIDQIPNGFAFESIASPAQMDRVKLFFAGRTSGPKGERTSHFIRKLARPLLEKFPTVDISFAGGPLANFDADTMAALNSLKRDFGDRVATREYVSKELIHQLVDESSLVIGSGRIAIDSLARGRAVLALGEANCGGLVNASNLEQAIASNFGDICVRGAEINYEALERSLHEFAAAPSNPEAALVEHVRARFRLDMVAKKVRQVYERAVLERRIPARVPALMYHKVVAEGYESPHKTYVTAATFEHHLSTLREAGFESVTFADIDAATRDERQLPKKPVLITFDDGYQGTFDRALPLLQRYGFRAVFYLLGREDARYNDWDASDSESALISMHDAERLRDAGMEIGAHGVNHRHLKELSTEEIAFEVRESKSFLERRLKMPVLSFAYPYGTICDRSKEAVREHGFRFAVATDSGGRTFHEDPFQIFRANVFPHDGAWQIRKKASRFYRAYYRWKRRK